MQTPHLSRQTGKPETRPRWKRELAEAIRDPDELCQILGLDPALGRAAVGASGVFPFLVPRGFVARMQPGNPTDPLLLQVLPSQTNCVRFLAFLPIHLPNTMPVGRVACCRNTPAAACCC